MNEEKPISRRKRAVHRVKKGVKPIVRKLKKPSLRERTESALSTVPRITNDTVAEHREEVLKDARKYKYPLQHSRYKIVIISSTLLALALVSFLVYVAFSLYKVQATSSLTYRVAQILPFPVAKAGERYVSYEDYLFKLRRYMHYYETQQKVDFTSESGRRQLELQKPRTLEKVIENAYVKQLATQHNVTVTSYDVRQALDTLRIKNQLGEGDQGLRDIANKFFGWSLNDLKRELRSDILAQKVAQKLDAEALRKARQALTEVRGGADFAATAAKLSEDDSTKGNGGRYADTAIGYGSQEVPLEIVQALERMKPNDVSEVITTPSTFEVVKLLSTEGGKFKAAHISVKIRPVDTFTQELRREGPPHAYIRFKQVQ